MPLGRVFPDILDSSPQRIFIIKKYIKKQIEIDIERGYKICTACENKKELKEFHYRKYHNSYNSKCKYCSNRNIPSKNKEINTEIHIVNGIKCKTCIKCKNTKEIANFDFRKDYQKLDNRCWECKSNYNKQYRQNNLERLREQEKEWYYNNPEKVKEKAKNYIKSGRSAEKRKEKYLKIKNDPIFIMKETARQRIRNCLKKRGIKKSQKTAILLGCTIEHFKNHLQSKFLPGMTWDNYGQGEDKWHVDHIIPCRSFDLSKEEEQLKCFHYSNLQPLWGVDNIKKLDKMPDGRLARHLFPTFM